MNNNRAAGVVVLYHPDLLVIENIRSYIEQLEKLFIIDNSEFASEFFADSVKSNSKCEYIFNRGNLGIAAALNIGAQKAIEAGYSYLLTMDQDSKASENMVQTLINFYKKNTTESIGIVTPFHNNKGVQKSPASKTSILLTAMTSGNLLNLEAFKKTGPFREELFIDYVDKEYCLRLRKLGYKVIRLNDLMLIHNLGDARIKKILLWNFYITNHSPLRLYYRTRNRFRLISKYKLKFPLYCLDDLKNFLIEIFKIIVYEKQVKEKLLMILIGIKDFRKNISGKYQVI